MTELRHAGTLVLETPGGPIQAKAVILAIPAYAAGGILRGVHTGLAVLCEDVPYASTATVAFGYHRDQVGHEMRGSGFVVPRVERSPLLAATWVTSKWPHRAPADHVLLRGFLGGGRDPRRLDQTDDELIDRARGARGHVHLGVALFASVRWTRQSPQYEVGHLERLATIERHLTRFPGLFVTGSGFRSIGIPDCIADGRKRRRARRRLSPRNHEDGKATKVTKRRVRRSCVFVANVLWYVAESRDASHTRRLAIALFAVTTTAQQHPSPGALTPQIDAILKSIKAADKGQLAVSEEDGRFMRVLIGLRNAKSILEIGAASGYSGIWLGLGARESHGHVVSIEFDPQRAKEAAANIQKAGLTDVVRVVHGDAFVEIPRLQGTFDLVFLDAWKPDYKRFFDMVYPRLDAGGVFLAHNVINKSSEMKPFLDTIQNNPGLLTSIVSPGSEGMSVSYKLR